MRTLVIIALISVSLYAALWVWVNYTDAGFSFLVRTLAL